LLQDFTRHLDKGLALATQRRNKTTAASVSRHPRRQKSLVNFASSRRCGFKTGWNLPYNQYNYNSWVLPWFSSVIMHTFVARYRNAHSVAPIITVPHAQEKRCLGFLKFALIFFYSISP